MKKKLEFSLFFSLSISVFLLWVLGTWQINKHSILKKNNTLYNSSKLNVLKVDNFDINIRDLTYIKADSIKLFDKYLYLEPRTRNGVVGFHRITVYKIKNNYLLVNEGFVKEKFYENHQNNKKVLLEGYIIKIPKPKIFELKNDKEKKIWYTLDLEDLKKEFGLPLSPYILYRQNFKPEDTNEAVMPNIVSKKINHFNYALTWYFLSLSLCVIFYIYFKKNYCNYE